MKGIDILCASPASTAICSTLERRSLDRERSQSRLLERQGSKAFEPSNILPDQSRRDQRPRKSTERRRSNADQSAKGIEPSPGEIEENARRSTHRSSSNYISRFSCSAIDQLAVVPYKASPAPKVVKKCPVINNDPLLSSTSLTDDIEVVVLRVSLHCQGCVGKVRKHISKMEGRQIALAFCLLVKEISCLPVLHELLVKKISNDKKISCLPVLRELRVKIINRIIELMIIIIIKYLRPIFRFQV